MPPEWTKLLGPYLDKLNRGLDPNQEIDPLTLPSLPQGLPAGLPQSLPQNWLAR
jgi:hypothetical protein